MVVANKFSFGKQYFKYFICYKDDRKIITLFIFCPEMTIYRKDFDKTKCMYFLIKEEKVHEI